MESSVQQIMQQLKDTGFPESLEWNVQVHYCFQPQKFVVPFNQVRGPDQLKYQILFAQGESIGQYAPIYYDAWLTRPVEIHPDQTFADLVNSIKQQMLVVNWESLLEKQQDATVADFSDLKIVQQVIAQLRELDEIEGGAYYAYLLKMRYWSKTPFEVYTGANSQLRSVYEVCQRFHFFADGGGITLDEAYRFLLHRWREKQMQQSHKGRGAVGREWRQQKRK